MPQIASEGVAPSVAIPPRPRTIAESGLTLAYIVDLVLRAVYAAGELTGQLLVEELMLPYEGILDEAIGHLRRETLLEVKGTSGLGEKSYRLQVTSKGGERARELAERTQYIGPAPVPLKTYSDLVLRQSTRNLAIDQEQLNKAFGHLVLNAVLLQQIGPALNSGRSLFLYGPAGNGKTSIAEAAANLLSDAVLLPYAVLADNQVIRLFDPAYHRALPSDPAQSQKLDRRWVLSQRPVVVVGGELNISALDLVYDLNARFYEAPLQMKANTGLLLIDDFGRQQMRPQDLLNRWIVPLEKRVDYLTLHTGKKLEVPFDTLIVFSTNIPPRNLVDEAFLRRIRYKIEVGNPTLLEYREILRRVCQKQGLSYSDEGLKYLLSEQYSKRKIEMRAVHPRDLIDQLIDIARFRKVKPELSPELLEAACRSYFVDL